MNNEADAVALTMTSPEVDLGTDARVETCRICGAQGIFANYTARELMFGSREEFVYFDCSACGCLQIQDVPDDLHRHYPPDYYSQKPTSSQIETGGIRRAVVRHLCRRLALRPDAAYTKLLERVLPGPEDFAEVGVYLRAARLRNSSEGILDVGCGASPKRLAAMRRCGFENVLGIDPFLPGDASYCGVPVKSCELGDLDGQFGLIMFHHSLEHVPDPLSSLKLAANILRPGGACLIRIPVMNTHFWKEFGCSWAELDPPRHLYLMSIRTVEWLSQAAGFVLESLKFESQGWELAASDLYRRDIPMFERKSTGLHSNLTMFTPAEMAKYEHAASTLNDAADGGRACFVLRRNS